MEYSDKHILEMLIKGTEKDLIKWESYSERGTYSTKFRYNGFRVRSHNRRYEEKADISKTVEVFVNDTMIAEEVLEQVLDKKKGFTCSMDTRGLAFKLLDLIDFKDMESKDKKKEEEDNMEITALAKLVGD